MPSIATTKVRRLRWAGHFVKMFDDEYFWRNKIEKEKEED
jgi:hypothetical protein